MPQSFSIYTKTGDDGTTGLANGERRPKSDARIIAIGSLDEVNASLGVVIAELASQNQQDSLIPALKRIQNHLFNIGSSLALAPGFAAAEDETAWLEQQIDRNDTVLPQLNHFILPGGCRAGAELHRARTCCRRAEREVLHLSTAEQVESGIQIYLNRLSDLLFVFARAINQQQKCIEEQWIKR